MYFYTCVYTCIPMYMIIFAEMRVLAAMDCLHALFALPVSNMNEHAKND
jgi:hypothetical protein